MVHQTRQIQSSLPSIKWGSWIDRQGNKKIIRTVFDNRTRMLDKSGLAAAMLMFRNTPRSPTDLSPAQLVFGHHLRDSLPFSCQMLQPQNRYKIEKLHLEINDRQCHKNDFSRRRNISLSQTRSTSQFSRSNHQKVDPHRQNYRIQRNWSQLLGQGRQKGTSLQVESMLHYYIQINLNFNISFMIKFYNTTYII
jgi:hypothetical protein